MGVILCRNRDAVSSSKVRDKGVDCETIFGNDNVCAGAQQGVCDEFDYLIGTIAKDELILGYVKFLC